MGESQSRYSIVERLTDSKLELINSRNKLDEQIVTLMQNIKLNKKDLDEYKITAKEDTDRLIRAREVEIGKNEDTLKFYYENKENKLSAIEAKIKEVDKALATLEAISKASVAEAKSKQ